MAEGAHEGKAGRTVAEQAGLEALALKQDARIRKADPGLALVRRRRDGTFHREVVYGAEVLGDFRLNHKLAAREQQQRAHPWQG